MRYINNGGETATYDHPSGTFTLSGIAAAGRGTISGRVSNGDQFAVHCAAGDDWEIARVEVVSGELVRQSTDLSTTGGAVDFSGPVTITVVVDAGALPILDGAAPEYANGASAIAMGASARAAGADTMALGRQAIAEHEGTICTGYNSVSWAPWMEVFRTAWRWAGREYTFGTTPGRLGLNSGSSGLIEIPEYAAVIVRAMVVGYRGADFAVYAAEVTACVRRLESGSVEIVGSPTVNVVGASGGVTASATIAVSGSSVLEVQVVGEAAQEWFWSGHVLGAVAGPI